MRHSFADNAFECSCARLNDAALFRPWRCMYNNKYVLSCCCLPRCVSACVRARAHASVSMVDIFQIGVTSQSNRSETGPPILLLELNYTHTHTHTHTHPYPCTLRALCFGEMGGGGGGGELNKITSSTSDLLLILFLVYADLNR